MEIAHCGKRANGKIKFFGNFRKIINNCKGITVRRKIYRFFQHSKVKVVVEMYPDILAKARHKFDTF